MLLSIVAAAVAAASGPAPAELTVTATDYAFVAPDTARAGLTRVRLVSRGREPHVLQLVRVGDGHDAAEALDALGAGGALPEWLTLVGGPTVPPPGGASEVTLRLAPGRYVLLCPIPSPADHTPHMAKGMVRTLTVVGPHAPASPPADGRVVLDDYGFLLVPGVRAGRQTLRVENRAAQPHEVVFVRLAEGKRAADFTRWAATFDGPPPGEVVAGTTALSRGRTALLPADLRPGLYALLCFARDEKDGRSHVAHGMVREVEVR